MMGFFGDSNQLLYPTPFPLNLKALYDIYTMLDQHCRRWADIVYILYKCFDVMLI